MLTLFLAACFSLFAPGASLNSTLPKAHFGQTGEIRMLAPNATPFVAQTLQKQQQRGAGRSAQPAQPDDSEI